MKQLLTESVILSLAGAAVGLVIAFGAIRGLIALAPMDAIRTDAIHIDGTVLLYTLAIALGTGLLFGLAPAIQASRADLQHALKDGARTAGERHGQWVRRGLVVAEMALALMLLIGAGLLLKSFARLQGVSPGFDPTHLATLSVSLPDAKYKDDAARTAFFRRLASGSPPCRESSRPAPRRTSRLVATGRPAVSRWRATSRRRDSQGRGAICDWSRPASSRR
jgi:putative ABC transport system permease protein